MTNAKSRIILPSDPEAAPHMPTPTRLPKPQSYVKGSHAARVRAEQDERRVELLALHDVLSAQRDGLNDQIEDIGAALSLLSQPSNVVSMQAGE